MSASPPPPAPPRPNPPFTRPTVISADGVAFVKHWEGRVLTAYRCPAGVLTIGYGHTGPDVSEGEVITATRADLLLIHDLAAAAAAVRHVVTAPLNQPEFDALTSFAFNCGAEALATSTLLRLLNAGHPEAVPGQLARWIHGGGAVLPGLVARRHAEGILWTQGLSLGPVVPVPMPQTVDRPDLPA